MDARKLFVCVSELRWGSEGGSPGRARETRGWEAIRSLFFLSLQPPSAPSESAGWQPPGREDGVPPSPRAPGPCAARQRELKEPRRPNTVVRQGRHTRRRESSLTSPSTRRARSKAEPRACSAHSWAAMRIIAQVCERRKGVARESDRKREADGKHLVSALSLRGAATD